MCWGHDLIFPANKTCIFILVLVEQLDRLMPSKPTFNYPNQPQTACAVLGTLRVVRWGQVVICFTQPAWFQLKAVRMATTPNRLPGEDAKARQASSKSRHGRPGYPSFSEKDCVSCPLDFLYVPCCLLCTSLRADFVSFKRKCTTSKCMLYQPPKECMEWGGGSRKKPHLPIQVCFGLSRWIPCRKCMLTGLTYSCPLGRAQFQRCMRLLDRN